MFVYNNNLPPTWQSETTEFYDNVTDDVEGIITNDDGEYIRIILELAVLFGNYFPICVVMIGVVGNISCFLLLSQAKYKSSSTCFYMKALVVSDSLYLVSSSLMDTFVAWFKFEYQAIECAFLRSLMNLPPATSAALLASMSIDRLMAVAIPLKAKVMCSVSRATKVTLCICIILIIAHVPYQFIHTFVIVGLSNYGKTCFIGSTSIWTHYYAHFRLITTYYAPLIITIIANCGIIYIISVQRRRRSEMQQGRENPEGKQQDGHITKMLLAVSVCSIFFQLPNQFAKLYIRYSGVFSGTRRSRVIQRFITAFTRLFLCCNYAMNFYAFALPMPKFRREIRTLLMSGFSFRYRCQRKSSSREY
jgi:thyrotropin-releasing hormone receptor